MKFKQQAIMADAHTKCDCKTQERSKGLANATAEHAALLILSTCVHTAYTGGAKQLLIPANEVNTNAVVNARRQNHAIGANTYNRTASPATHAALSSVVMLLGKLRRRCQALPVLADVGVRGHGDDGASLRTVCLL